MLLGMSRAVIQTVSQSINRGMIVKRYIDLAADYLAFLALAAIYLMASILGLMDIGDE